MNEKTLEAFVELRLNGHTELFYKELGGLEFIYRPLCFYEYDTILELEEYIDGPEINDHIVQMCTLYPKDINKWLEDAKAAEPDHYAQAILDSSGWNDSKKMLEVFKKSKKQSDELPAFIELVICTVYKSLKPEDVKRMTLKEQMLLYTKAEVIYSAGGNSLLDIEQVLQQDITEKRIMPVPPGMQSTDPSDFDMPDFDKILQGKEVY